MSRDQVSALVGREVGGKWNVGTEGREGWEEGRKGRTDGRGGVIGLIGIIQTRWHTDN